VKRIYLYIYVGALAVPRILGSGRGLAAQASNSSTLLPVNSAIFAEILCGIVWWGGPRNVVAKTGGLLSRMWLPLPFVIRTHVETTTEHTDQDLLTGSPPH